MKNWNKPEIEEINMTLTMGGDTPSATETTSVKGGVTTYFIKSGY